MTQDPADKSVDHTASIRVYRKALDSDLPSDIRVMVERQLLEVKEAHDHICSLERSPARNAWFG